jgi:hypothetical protein
LVAGAWRELAAVRRRHMPQMSDRQRFVIDLSDHTRRNYSLDRLRRAIYSNGQSAAEHERGSQVYPGLSLSTLHAAQSFGEEENNMTIAAIYRHRSFPWLATIAAGTTAAAIGLLTAGSALSTVSGARADNPPTFSSFSRLVESTEPAPFAIVPSPVMDTNPQFFFGTGDGSNGYYAEQPPR